MSYTWGGTTLKVARNSYNPPMAESGVVEMELLPDSSGGAMSVIQQAGRNRKRCSFKGYATKANYEAMLTDFYNATEKTFVDIDSVSFTAIIESFSATREDNKLLPYIYNITLMEV